MTMSLIETKTLGADAASIEFTSIPQTFTDLVILGSLRSDRASNVSDGFNVRPNSATTDFTFRRLFGNGSAAASSTSANSGTGLISGSTATASTFGNFSVYIPNYSGATNKSWSADSVTENNATEAIQAIYAVLWSDTSAITSLIIESATASNLVAGSTISLYGVTKGTDGIVTTS